MAAILIVEDEPVLTHQLMSALEDVGHHVETASTGEGGLEAARSGAPDLVLLDLRLPDASGLDVLDKLRALDEGLPIVLMTAYGSVRDAVEAMRRGASDYLQKPLDLAELGLLVGRLLADQRRERELAYLRGRERHVPDTVLGSDPRLAAIFDQAERLRVASLPPGRRPTVLLTGETGVGKGVVARAVHELLGGGPFIEVNCSAMPASLVEAELFGHERGAFTGARFSRPGLFEAAEGGSIFLDEISELELDLQAKFLRVIEDKRVRRLGSTRDRAVDVHILAASNRDLDRAVHAERFRADLLHRLRVLSFELPPLRERGEDLRVLARLFCEELSAQYGGLKRQLSRDAEDVLVAYPWPGNVRELRNVIERAVLIHPGETLEAEDIAALLDAPRASGAHGFVLPDEGLNLDELGRDLARQALSRTRGNRTRAAALLGISRDTLRYRMERWGLARDED